MYRKVCSPREKGPLVLRSRGLPDNLNLDRMLDYCQMQTEDLTVRLPGPGGPFSRSSLDERKFQARSLEMTHVQHR
jgi:hypothetical protein